MTKASLFASAAVATLTLGAVPAFAQNAAGPFADVPTDHWAYSAVDKLQKAGIVIGYPDMTYGGKRAMTRYEFAVAIARLLDKIPTTAPAPPPGITQDQLNQALAPYALKSDLAGLAKQSDVDQLRRLVQEFQTELTTLGVDLDAVKRRLDGLEGRVKAIETELKRVQISGAVNVMGRANNRFNDSKSIIDWDGFQVTKGYGSRGGLLADTRVLHDVDLGIKARLSETATTEVVLNYGNYLPYLGSISSYTGARSDRAQRGIYPGQTVNQDESLTVYKAVIDVPLRLIGVGGVDLQVGRLPIQYTPYTLKLIDTDSYFNNAKTDLGDIPVDGAKARFNLGPVAATAFASKVDPIKFVSNETNSFTDQSNFNSYGLYAGAAKGAFGTAATPGGFRGFSRSYIDSSGSTVVNATGNRPSGSLINPSNNGAMLVEQMAGVRATVGSGSLGTLGGTIIGLSGNPSVAPVGGGSNDNFRSFDRVYVYGADLNTHFGSIGLVGSYTKSDTAGTRLNGDGSIDSKTRNKITKNNDAWDAAASYAHGNLSLRGGYKEIGPYYGAPGYWDKIGSWTNPIDIKGAYVQGQYSFSNTLALTAAGKFYQGTGKAQNDGGLTKDDKIQNLKAGLKYGLTSASGVDLGIERTEYKLGAGPTKGKKPLEYFYNIGYGYSFNPATSFKVLYQIVDYRDNNSGFDTLNKKGGIAAAQFSVKF